MSQAGQNTSLSISARLLCYLGPPSAILLTAAASPQTALFAPFAFAPPVWAYKKWKKSNDADSSRHGELESILWTFAASATLGVAVGGAFQILTWKATSFFIFPNSTIASDFFKEFTRGSLEGISPTELAFRAQYSTSWQNWVTMLTFSYIGAGIGEEVIKLLPITINKYRGTPKERQRRNKSYLDYVIACAMGFSVVESIGFIHIVCKEAERNWPKAILTLVERTPGVFGHIVVALLSAIRATRRDFYGERLGWVDILGPAVLLHGTCDFVLFATSALHGNIGWIHPSGVWTTVGILGGYIALVGSIGWQVKKEWRDLDARDIAKKASENDVSR